MGSELVHLNLLVGGPSASLLRLEWEEKSRPPHGAYPGTAAVQLVQQSEKIGNKWKCPKATNAVIFYSIRWLWDCYLCSSCAFGSAKTNTPAPGIHCNPSKHTDAEHIPI